MMQIMINTMIRMFIFLQKESILSMQSYEVIDITDIFLFGLENAVAIPELSRQWIVVYMDDVMAGNLLKKDMIEFFKSSFENIRGRIGSYCTDYVCEYLPFERVISHSFYLTDKIDHIRDLNIYN